MMESPAKRGGMFNRSSAMSEIMGGSSASPARTHPCLDMILGAATASAVKSTPKEKMSPPPALRIESPGKLCAKCIGEEMIHHKHEQELWEKQKDLEDQQRLLEELRRKDEEERRRRESMQNEMKRAANEALTASAKKHARPDTADERHVLEQANAEYDKHNAESKGKKAEETAKYREELRSQMEARRLAAKDAKDKDKAQEIANQGLSLDYYKGDKYKDAREQQKLVLKQQLVDEQMRKSRDWEKDSKDKSLADEQYAAQERERAEDERRRKAMSKGDYEAYLREKERSEAAKRQQRTKEQEEYLERQRAVQEQVAREKMEDQEKKKSLGSYLISQMKDKSAKKAEKSAADDEVVEHGARAPTASSPTKFNSKAIKQDNLRQMEEHSVIKAHEKDLQRDADEKYLAREKQLEEERRRAEQMKRDQERKNFEDARRSMENKRSQQLEAKHGDKDDLDYYERMNNEIKGQIKAEQTQNKGKLKEYSESLQKQIANNEEAKRKQRELELENERAAKGMALDSYKRNNGAMKSGYKDAIKQQYNESLMRKDKGRFATEEAESDGFLKDVLDEGHLASEEARKKQAQHEAYLKAQEKLKNAKLEEENNKKAEQSKRLEESGKLRGELEREKQLLREKQKKMGMDLEAQMEAKKSKDKGEKFEWVDERAKKHAQEIEERVSRLKEEILRCIRCNAVIGKKAGNK